MRYASRATASLAIVVAVSCLPATAAAQDVDQCIASSTSGQELRDQGDLIAAEQQFVQCASNSCPEVIRRDCQNWLSELGPSIPSIRVKQEGELAGQGRVLIDEREVRLTKALIRLNPGQHEIKWQLEGRETSITPLTIGVGSTGKDVVIRPGEAIVVPVREEGFDLSQIPPASLILGGVGVFAIGSFAVLGIVSRSNFDTLSNSCGTSCDPSAVASARDPGIAADISLLLGIAAIGTGTALFFLLDDPAPQGPSVAFGVIPSPLGAHAAFSGRF